MAHAPNVIIRERGLVMPGMFQAEYDILPRYRERMAKVFEKYDLEWEATEWLDDEEQRGTLIGTKENLTAFLVSAFGKVSEGMITPVKED